MTANVTAETILVIRLGALGDLVLCNGAFQAIRLAHPHAKIILLTQPMWVSFARTMPWFDDVITDTRPEPWRLGAWLDLWQRVRQLQPTMIYDLQGKHRQNILHFLLGGAGRAVAWSGAAWRCRYPRAWPPQPQWHFTDFLAAQLANAGITIPTQPDFSWLDAPLQGHDQQPTIAIPDHFALLIPGCSPQHPQKRWPASAYAALATKLMQRGLHVVMIGTKAEADVLAAIKNAAPAVIDLGGHTSLLQIGAIARRAHVVIGNDTGPTHIAAAVGAPTLTLFNPEANALWSCARGARAHYLQECPLAKLTAERVMAAVKI